MEFGGASTRDAASYWPGLCKAWANGLLTLFDSDTSAKDLAAVKLVQSGPVKRHIMRGETADSSRTIREREDAACTAGMRNPAELREGWPDLWTGMEPIADFLWGCLKENPDLRDIPGAFGKNPSRQPPSDAELQPLRAALGMMMGLSATQTEAHHPATTWRYEVARAVA